MPQLDTTTFCSTIIYLCFFFSIGYSFFQWYVKLSVRKMIT